MSKQLFANEKVMKQYLTALLNEDDPNFNSANLDPVAKLLQQVPVITEKEESMERFNQRFGWKLNNNKDKECQSRRLQWDWSLRNPHEVEVLKGDRLWDLISGQNKYDLKLYEYAQVLFDEQSKLFSSGKNS